jgi:putative tributyrin esterase
MGTRALISLLLTMGIAATVIAQVPPPAAGQGQARPPVQGQLGPPAGQPGPLPQPLQPGQPPQAPLPQGPALWPPRVIDETFQSEALGRPMKYRVLLPGGYAQTQRRYPTLYLLHGLTGSAIDWESRTRLFDHLQGLGLIVIMPDGQNAWYTNSAGEPKDRFEDYIARDLVREVDARFRTIATRHMRALAGLSMGGYGAMKFALKYPRTFQFVGSFSGALKAAMDPEFGKTMGQLHESIQRIFGPVGSKTRMENDIYALVKKADPGRMPFLYLDCGTKDRLIESNREFVALLSAQKIAYEYRERPGAHTWAFWDHQLPEMLRVMREQMNLQPAR